MTAPSLGTMFTAADLLATEFPEPRWAVPGIIPEGLTLLAGAPKLGKSWLALNIANAIASGKQALGKVEVDQGKVLYLALEDPPRRLKDRLEKMLYPWPRAPEGLTFATSWRRFGSGGDALLDDALSGGGYRFVIVDVFAKVRPERKPNSDPYMADYQAATSLKEIADRHKVAITALTHTRKAEADDFLESVSGTNGLAGAADTVVMLKRSRGQAAAELHVTGRDVEEAKYALKFDPQSGVWEVLDGPPEMWTKGKTRTAILTLLAGRGPMAPKDIAIELAGVTHDAAKQACRRMADDGDLETDGDGLYRVPVTLSLMSPASPDLRLQGTE